MLCVPKRRYLADMKPSTPSTDTRHQLLPFCSTVTAPPFFTDVRMADFMSGSSRTFNPMPVLVRTVAAVSPSAVFRNLAIM